MMPKRTFLKYSVIAFAIIGLMFSVVPFLMSMMPPQYKVDIEYKKYNSTLIVDISELKEGNYLTVSWQGAPISIYKRSKSDIASLRKSNFLVYDPFSKNQELPDWWRKMSVDMDSAWVKSFNRSLKPEYFVFNRISPVYGCAVMYIPSDNPQEYGFPENWLGGFFDPCHHVKFDIAGRVYFGRSSGKHLLIPPHRYIDKHTIELYPNG